MLPDRIKAYNFATGPTHLALKRISITGTIVGTLLDIKACLDYARRGLLRPIHEVGTHCCMMFWCTDRSQVRGKSAWPEAVQQLKRGEVKGRIVIDFNKD